MEQVTSRGAALLFVYGTLRPFADIPMARWLASVGVPLGEARVPGRLFDLGRYPGLLVPRRRGEWVAGDLYRVTRRVLAMLDRYEAGRFKRPMFERVSCRVEFRRAATHAGSKGRGRSARGQRAAWLYLYRRPVLGRVRIASGDYRLYLGTSAVVEEVLDAPANGEPVSGQ